MRNPRQAILLLAILLSILSLTPVANALQVNGVQRGVHEGFELIIITCDSISHFEMEYDQVLGECRVSLKGGRIPAGIALAMERWRPRETISGAEAVPRRGMLIFKTRGTVYLRDYQVSGPPALILDFSRDPDTTGALPFECDKQRYLALGGRAEREGRLELALRYVQRVRKQGGSEFALTHRSGVIEQRLGRWDLALESFAKTAQMAEFAADAHARRTMIFMAQGDTLASGQEWAGYFHRGTSEPDIDTTKTSTPPAEVVAKPVKSEPTHTAAHSLDFLTSGVIQAGGGDGASYLYYGWGLLVVGMLTLVGLWAGSTRSRKLAAEEAVRYQPFQPERPKSEFEFLRSFEPSTSHRQSYAQVQPSRQETSTRSRYSDPISPLPIAAPAEHIERLENSASTTPALVVEVPSKIVTAYHESDRAPTEPLPPQLQHIPRVPADRIVELAAQGLNEGEIAGRLEVGRDEVKMVLNLARASRSGREGRPENE